jgi:hypothetical protein
MYKQSLLEALSKAVVEPIRCSLILSHEILESNCLMWPGNYEQLYQNNDVEIILLSTM